MTIASNIQDVLDATNERIQELIDNKRYSPEEAEKIVQDAISKIKGIKASNINDIELNIGVDSIHRIGHPHIPIHVDPIPIPKPEDIIPDPGVHIPTQEELEEQARRLAKELADAAKAKLVEDVHNAINDLKNQIPNPTEQAGKMIAEIESYKEQLNSLLDQMNPVALLNKALDKAEQISEEYIDSKMVQVFEPLHLKGKSDVEFSLDGNKINGSVSLYLVLEDFNGDFTQQYLKSLTITGEIDLSNLTDIHLSDPVLHDGNINIQEEIKNRIEEKQAEIISGLTQAVIDSYLPIFTVINRFKEIMKI